MVVVDMDMVVDREVVEEEEEVLPHWKIENYQVVADANEGGLASLILDESIEPSGCVCVCVHVVAKSSGFLKFAACFLIRNRAQSRSSPVVKSMVNWDVCDFAVAFSR